MPPELLMSFPYYTIYCGYSMFARFEYMTLDPVHMLLPKLATWFLSALVGFLSDNPGLSCSNLEA